MIYLLILLLIFFVLLQGTVTSLPLALIFLLCLTIVRRDELVVMLAFFAGLVIDILRLHAVGTTSVFLLFFLLLVLLYERKYEINSYPFVFFAAFFGSLAFVGIFGGHGAILHAGICSVIGIVVFKLLRLSFRT